MHDFEQFDYYQLLGVPHDAPADDIKRAYRQEIATYHPDKWSNAGPAEQDYARKRAAMITEAYSILHDKKARGEYSSRSPAARSTPATPVTPVTAQSRAERLEQLYQRGRLYLEREQWSDAAVVLRQLQQADPFYRDSADLLARADRALKQPAAAPAARQKRSLGWWLSIGGAGVATLLLAIWLLGGSKTDQPEPTAPAVAAITALTSPTVPILSPTLEPVATPTLEPVATLEPEPTLEPTVEPTLEPTAEPTLEPTAEPIVEPTDAPVPADLTGPVLVADDLDGGSWPVGNGGNWNFAFVNGQYHMTMRPGVNAVWSFSAPLPGNNVTLAADVNPVAGSGGLLLGFVDGSSYYRYVLAADGSWAFQQRSGGGIVVLAAGDGLGPGRLAIAQRGATSRLYWNSVLLAEVNLPAFPAGSYGFILASSGASDVYFDTLRIRGLE